MFVTFNVAVFLDIAILHITKHEAYILIKSTINYEYSFLYFESIFIVGVVTFWEHSICGSCHFLGALSPFNLRPFRIPKILPENFVII